MDSLPNVEFQALLTEIASIKPDAVFVFFAGGGAAKFIKDYAAAGLKTKIPLFGSGFLTDGVLDAVDKAAEGLETTLHYADGLNTERDREFRAAYGKAYRASPTSTRCRAMTQRLLLHRTGCRERRCQQEKRNDRGDGKSQDRQPAWHLDDVSKAHNPIQDIYLRKVVGRENKMVGVAHKALADPARGCKM